MADDFERLGLARAARVSEAALRQLLDSLHAQVGADQFYVFWTAGAGGGAGAGERRRLLLAFPTPDAALAFAQGNRLGTQDRPRLRRLTLAQLIQAVLREPAITALLLAEENEQARATPGRLPSGLRIERAELLRRLAQPPPE
jgi:hypothetical protein